MKIKNAILKIIIGLTIYGCTNNTTGNFNIKLNDKVRVKQIKDMKFGMMIHWGFSTFSGEEWTSDEWVTTLDKDASDFKANRLQHGSVV